MSRRTVSAAAAASRSAPASAGSSRTSGCGSANGRIASAHPSGVAQRSQSADEVADTVRRANATASTAVASPVAIRRVGASWLVTAPTPANTGTTETIASAR